MAKKEDPIITRSRALAIADGHDPDERVPYEDGRSQPRWCLYRDAARKDREAEALAAAVTGQPGEYKNAPLIVLGEHHPMTLEQMKNCMSVGNVVAGVVCADGHIGYAQPVGGVIAYKDQISVSGVGFDIACGNKAVKLSMKRSDLTSEQWEDVYRKVNASISFGIGRANETRVEDEVFDRDWSGALMADFKDKARAQLGTVGSGNHYVDLFTDSEDNVWIGVHFGSRGLGHTTATRALNRSGGKEGIHVPPVVLDVASEQGQIYLEGMNIAGEYAYAGRDWVVEKVRSIIGGDVMDSVHNHHNYAWYEHGLWVVRKGATPAHPGQRGFVGGSMGEEAVIIRGTESPTSTEALYSTIHGAGRNFGRREAKRRFTREQMEEWLVGAGVRLFGGDLDESPMAYKRLPDVLAFHQDTVEVEYRLKPFAVFMAGEGEIDPYKD